MTDSESVPEYLLERYSDSRTTRSLVQLVPFAGVVDTFLTATWDQIRKRRAKEFFDKLDSGAILLSEDIVDSEEFLHCFFITTRAALSNRRKEKIELFASLLLSAFDRNGPRNIDDFEELLAILDDITYREWSALVILDRYSDAPREDSQNDLQWSLTFWATFVAEVVAKLEVPSSEFTSFMNRISRTGLYDQFVGGFMDYSGGIGMLTPRFHRLKGFLLNEHEEQEESLSP